ncbi:hypothetical protein D3C84_759280 [compost metagenome]
MLTPLVDLAGLELARQVLVGAGQLDGQGFSGFGVADAKAQVGVQALMQQRGTLADAVVRAVSRNIETWVMFKGFERYIFLITQTARPPTGHRFHGKHATCFQVVLSRQQQVLVLLAIEADRQRVNLE